MALKCGYLPSVIRALPVGERAFLKAAWLWQSQQEADNPMGAMLEGR